MVVSMRDGSVVCVMVLIKVTTEVDVELHSVEVDVDKLM